MDNVTWLTMYHAWQEDLKEKEEEDYRKTVMLGAFSNPEMAKKMIKANNHDFESDDEMYEKTLSELKESRNKKPEKSKKRKRKILT